MFDLSDPHALSLTAPARVLSSAENSEAQGWLPVTYLVFSLKDRDRICLLKYRSSSSGFHIVRQLLPFLFENLGGFSCFSQFGNGASMEHTKHPEK